MKIGRLNVQYHRMPKWMYEGCLSKAPSYIRVFWHHNYDKPAMHLFDVHVPKYGTCEVRK